MTMESARKAAAPIRPAVGVVDELSVEGGFGFPKKRWRRARRCPGSLGETALVIKEFGVIEIRTFGLGGGTLGDGEKFLNGGFATEALEAFVAFSQSFLYGTSHGLAGDLGNRLSETVGFRVFDIEAQGTSILR
jgi:hypothetical protein